MRRMLHRVLACDSNDTCGRLEEMTQIEHKDCHTQTRHRIFTFADGDLHAGQGISIVPCSRRESLGGLWLIDCAALHIRVTQCLQVHLFGSDPHRFVYCLASDQMHLKPSLDVLTFSYVC